MNQSLNARESNQILREMQEAERKAIQALGRYKFQMFGYWAAIWVHLNRISGAKRPNPFKNLVAAARVIDQIGGVK